jgi:esterase
VIAAERIGPVDGPSVWFLHGILGQGRNWRSFARRLVDDAPGMSAVLPDLRCHGASLSEASPHTLAACADDLDALAASHGEPRVVVAHSFGGKVALEWLARRSPSAGRATVVLDSPPSALPLRSPRGPTDPLRVIPALRAIPTPAADRDALRAPLRASDIPESIVTWLLSSTRHDADGWRFTWDLDGVEALLADYFVRDYRSFLRDTHHRIVLVRAGLSDRWTDDDLTFPAGPGVTRELLPRAGHWVHVDDPEGTFGVVRSALSEALGAADPRRVG